MDFEPFDLERHGAEVMDGMERAARSRLPGSGRQAMGDAASYLYLARLEDPAAPIVRQVESRLRSMKYAIA